MVPDQYSAARAVQLTRINASHFHKRTSSVTASTHSDESPPPSNYSPSSADSSANSPVSLASTFTSRASDSSYRPPSWLVDEMKFPMPPKHTFAHPRSESPMTEDDSCQFDAEDWFAQFRGDLDVSDESPAAGSMEVAGNVPVYDAAGNSRMFKSLISPDEAINDRQLVIFIRHFFCGACQAYIKALVSEINMQTYFTMPIPTSIIIIGCGSPALIPHYKSVTNCPFPIYADPTRQLFKNLGMRITFDALGKKRPEYMKDISPLRWVHGQMKGQMKVKGTKKFKGGNPFQIGGEFLFQDGQVTWCHRMKNYRNHAEVETIKKVLEID